MNKITFVPNIVDDVVKVDILVDDEPINMGNVKNIVPSLSAISYSMERLGKYECPIYTCRCGDAGCAGIDMLVLANESTIAWKMNEPLQFFYLFEYEQYADAFEDFEKSVTQSVTQRKLKRYYSF